MWSLPKTQRNTFTVEQCKHSATMARDHYMRVVYKGYLLPFGHRASLVKATERRFDSLNGKSYAYLHQRMFVIVQKPRKDFPVLGQANGARPVARVSHAKSNAHSWLLRTRWEATATRESRFRLSRRTASPSARYSL